MQRINNRNLNYVEKMRFKKYMIRTNNMWCSRDSAEKSGSILGSEIKKAKVIIKKNI